MNPLGQIIDPLLPVASDEAGPLVESYFVKLNSPTRQEALWLKFTFLMTPRRSGRRASVWAVHFDGETGRKRAFKRTYHMEDVSWEPDRLALRFGDNELLKGRTRGVLRDEEGSIAWDLTFTDESEPLMIYPPVLMKAPLPRFKQTSPMPDERFRGVFTVDGQDRSADGFHGMLGHNWGPRHTHRYAWVHANLFEDDQHGVFEGACGSLRMGGLDTPLLSTLSLRRHGRKYELNQILQLSRRRSDMSYYRWFFSVHEPPVRLEGVVQTVKEDMVGLYYDNPDGTMTYCLNSKIARLRLFLYEEGRPDVVLESHHAAFEMGTTDPHHGVQMTV